MRIVSVSPHHDASVCVLNNGEIEFFFKEERFTRIKKDSIPYISIYEAYKNIKGKVDLCIIASLGSKESYSIDLILKKLFNCKVIDLCNKHHMQHAALAFENSNFDEALVFVIDRNGSCVNNCIIESETVLHAKREKYFLSPIYKNYWAASIGMDDEVLNTLEYLNNENPKCKHVCRSSYNITKVYESATSLIGENPLENGKTMGLSSYGNYQKLPDLFLRSTYEEHNIPCDSYFIHDVNVDSNFRSVYFRNLKQNTIKSVPQNKYQLYANYAKHVQSQTQEQVSKFIRYYVEKTGIKNVVLTGGFALNIVANSYYVKQIPKVKFFFEPMADDTGNSIGASILMYKKITNSNKNIKIKDTFFHGHFYSLDNIRGRNIETSEVAELILQQKSIAVYQGYAESGHRALGNRSILFDATNPDAKDIVNKIKNREWYRPFAAMILEEDANVYFDMLGLSKSEYMTNSFNVRDNYQKLLTGVVHVDGSCRLQTINRDHSLYELLNFIKYKNGVGILLNTSFNLSGDSLVETPEQALETLNKSSLDYVWFPTIKKIV